MIYQSPGFKNKFPNVLVGGTKHVECEHEFQLEVNFAWSYLNRLQKSIV